MEPALTWLDLTVGDRDKMRRVLDLFNEQGTVDEMGLGSLRDALSDALFPGTSTIQTRLRYMLFIPWIYRRLEGRQISSDRVAQQARKEEIALIRPLLEDEDTGGVIGARSRGSLRRLPSSIYWAGLVRWGIFMHGQSQGWYHTHFKTLSNGDRSVERADDPGVVWSRKPNWHPRLPETPKSFPDDALFALTSDEAEFLQGRIIECCAGTLLAWLAREGSETPAESFWDDPSVCRAHVRVCDIVELARRFSLHVEGAPLLYNLMLAEKRGQDSDTDRIDRYRADLAEWSDRDAAETPFDAKILWGFLCGRGVTPPTPQRKFVEDWGTRVAELRNSGDIAGDAELRDLIAKRERRLKGKRARLANPARLLDWSGRVGVGRMDFRWFRVRQLLMDLHKGLGT